MKVLVVGGAGYIGSHACKALALAGHEPVTYDNLSAGHAGFVRWGPLERGDVRDAARLDDVLVRYQPDLVMHFAALAYAKESIVDPGKYYDVNINGTGTLLRAALAHDITRVVFSSTCATYGEPRMMPITEETPQVPINPYGYTKLVAERMLRDFETAYGLKWAALRYFNAAGCDPDGEVGESHDPETHVIPLALMSALGQRGTFMLFGDDYPTRDGSAVRDYVHVTDLASAHVLAAEYLLAGNPSIALNLATGCGTTVLELVAAIERVTGNRVPLNVAPRRPGDPPELFASADMARALLGWNAKHSGLGEIVATALQWLQRNDCA